MDLNKPKSMNQKLSNGYILPEGKLTPNALFVGGIDMKRHGIQFFLKGSPRVIAFLEYRVRSLYTVDENEIRDFFTRYGTVMEVKIITYRGGICKGYGFVYFSEDVNIQAIIEQQISFKGRKLKLGPAIMKERSSRYMGSHLVGPSSWMSPSQYIYCACCSPVGGGVTQPSPILSGSSPYNQPYSYNNFGGVMFPQMQMNYVQSPYTYQYTTTPWAPDHRARPVNQNFVDCGVQTMLTVL